jgi:hypothetical protein
MRHDPQQRPLPLVAAPQPTEVINRRWYYTVQGAQKVAVATGYVSPAVPAEIRRAKIAILGVE